MGANSAAPGRLLRYRDGGLTQVTGWEAELGPLESALTTLRSELASADLPAELRVSVLYHETWFGELVAKQRHLDEWVGDVADGFIRADGGDPGSFDLQSNAVLDATDDQITVGPAERSESVAQGEQDAQDLAEILGDAGILHPYDIANDPERLEELVAQVPELAEILERSEQYATDESYAAAFVNELGPEDTRVMLDLVNTYGIAFNVSRDGDGGAYDDVVVPFAELLGRADRSGELDESVRDVIFDLDPSDEPAMEGMDVDESFDLPALEAMRRRSLAIILDAGDFSPRTTADLADTITNQDGQLDPAATGYLYVPDHPSLASNDLIAMEALAESPEAANIFLRMDRDEYEGEYENLYLFSSGALNIDDLMQYGGLSEDEARERMDAVMAEVLQGGLIEHPLATGTTYSDEQTALMGEVIEMGAWEHTDASDPVRTVLAQATSPYTQDIAVLSEGGGPDLPDSRLPDLDPETIDRFLQEVSESEGGRVVLSQNAAALTQMLIDGEVPDIVGGDPTAFGTGERLSTAYYRELGEAWDEVQIGWQEQREALVNGWRTFTDPLVDLVSGKIVERIPLVSDVADLPLLGDAVDAITGEINESINSAIYDNAIPEPEVEAMTEWRDAIGPEVGTAVATALFENPESREHFLAQLSSQERAAIESGGVTLDEFRDLPQVQDAVNTYAGEVIDGFESDMAFNDVFGE